MREIFKRTEVQLPHKCVEGAVRFNVNDTTWPSPVFQTSSHVFTSCGHMLQNHTESIQLEENCKIIIKPALPGHH